MNTIYVILALKLIIAVSIINVWLFRSKKSSRWRGGEATNLRQEFESYGFPLWFMYTIGILKVILALLLIVSIWVPSLTIPAAAGIGVLMLGAITAHFYIKDRPIKSLPAASFMVAALIILVYTF